MTIGWITVEGDSYCPFCAAAYRVAHYATTWTPLTTAECADKWSIDATTGMPQRVSCEICGVEATVGV